MSALILMYHDISEHPETFSHGHRPYVLDPATFRLQMSRVSSTGHRILTVKDWCSLSHPPRAVILTFDDGHVSNHDIALPILREFGFTATFFITAGRIGTDNTMDWAQIRALHAAGMEIGSHTMTHRPPSTLNDKELRHELAESRRILEDGLGAPVTSISSPTGFFNPRMRNMAHEIGYLALCHGKVGFVSAGSDPYNLSRVAVKNSMAQGQFESLLRFRKSAVLRLRFRQWALERARYALGAESYLRFRRLLIRAS